MHTRLAWFLRTFILLVLAAAFLVSCRRGKEGIEGVDIIPVASSRSAVHFVYAERTFDLQELYDTLQG